MTARRTNQIGHGRRVIETIRGIPPAAGLAAPVVGLNEPEATDAGLTGAKAASLAIAARAGLPVLPGFVITTRTSASSNGRMGELPVPALEALHAAWLSLSDGGRSAVVARSSSPAEDGTVSSMAGRFLSLLDLRGWDAFLSAVDKVLASAEILSLDTGDVSRFPMAVLVQGQLDATAGGVLFGVDPVSGATDRLVLSAVPGGPDRLVSGAVSGTRFELSRRGRVMLREGDRVPGFGRAARRQAAWLANRTAALFGRPQDNEIAVDRSGALWLLQSRPVTSVSDTPAGPVLGPGPVAETFPDPLEPLEEDLWLDPMRRGMIQALRLTGINSTRRLDASPVLVSVGGRTAADLALLGLMPGRPSLLRRLDPRPPARRLRGAWRTGRLRAALPALAADLLDAADAELSSVTNVAHLSDEELLRLLRGGRQALTALHGHEILVGMLLAPDSRASSSAAIALRSLAAARAQGLDDAEVIARHPVILALVPPSIRPITLPPPQIALTVPAPSPVGDEAGERREQLRMRARWMQELTGRAAWEAGRRLAGRGVLEHAGDVRLLRMRELPGCLLAGAPAPRLDDRRRKAPAAALPVVFRLTATGRVVAVGGGAGGGTREGRPGGGGRGVGSVVHAGRDSVPAGSVLVTRTLDPSLATTLPGLSGLVSETGSVLSHLAILARELGVPTVVGVADALQRFAEGSRLIVDGDTGELTISPAAPPEQGGQP